MRWPVGSLLLLFVIGLAQGHLTQAMKHCCAKKLAKADIHSNFIPDFGMERALLCESSKFYNVVQVVITKKNKKNIQELAANFTALMVHL